jgi:hypothetical protein
MSVLMIEEVGGNKNKQHHGIKRKKEGRISGNTCVIIGGLLLAGGA